MNRKHILKKYKQNCFFYFMDFFDRHVSKNSNFFFPDIVLLIFYRSKNIRPVYCNSIHFVYCRILLTCYGITVINIFVILRKGLVFVN